MKTTSVILSLSLVCCIIQAQDICPCQENDYQFSQFSWNQSEASIEETAFYVPQNNQAVYELATPSTLTVDLTMSTKPETDKTAPETKANRSVPSPGKWINRQRAKLPNPKLRKHKRKSKKKYRGRCPWF